MKMISTDHKIIEEFLKRHPKQALSLIEDNENTEIASLLGSLPTYSAAKIIEGIIPYKAIGVLEILSVEDAVELLQELHITKTENLLMRMDESARKKMLSSLSRNIREAIVHRMNFSADSVGAYTDSLVFTLRDDHKISECLEMIRKQEATIHSQIFVLNAKEELMGFIEVQDLLTHREDQKVESILKERPITLLSHMSIEDVALEWDYRFNHLPVVDAEGVFVGTISRAKIGELSGKEQTQNQPVFKAGSALSELYRIGFISLLGTSPESNPKNN